MIRLKNVCKAYDGKRVLHELNLTLDRGILCLMAPSGAGKTTLLRLLLGLERPDAGEIVGVPVRAAVLFQEDRLSETLTVRANLKLALGGGYEESKAAALLSELGLKEVLGRRTATLSGGMKRRVALARALLFDAPVLLLDEPCQGLDAQNRACVLETIKRFSAGRTVLVITHEEEDCGRLGGRLFSLPAQ